ncbi:hypothetical protein LU293_07375 [Moraxella nasovis]|uniref:hypothetical protein n=1 Tax=Moraxella nasovis TaxID=2904121 RepID=UPI001F5FF7F4|nr:hypothetical protein [Moraxella nasovis]UNU72908.1 hypothetical protein LU293_07375 [Moraxella nasovis]
MNNKTFQALAKEFNSLKLGDFFDIGMGVSKQDFAEIAFSFFGNFSHFDEFWQNCHACITDIHAICQKLQQETKGYQFPRLFNHIRTNTPPSTAIDHLFYCLAKANPNIELPPPAVRQRAVEMVTLHLVFKQFAQIYHDRKKPFYAHLLKNHALKVLGGVQYLHGLPQDRILTLGMIDDKTKEDIHRQVQSEQGRQNALKATEPHRQERKQLGQRYLKIMQDKGFNFTQTAEYVFIHDNLENKKYEWIYGTLREAHKAHKAHKAQKDK